MGNKDSETFFRFERNKKIIIFFHQPGEEKFLKYGIPPYSIQTVSLKDDDMCGVGKFTKCWISKICLKWPLDKIEAIFGNFSRLSSLKYAIV